jgi:hypothetical protein
MFSGIPLLAYGLSMMKVYLREGGFEIPSWNWN